LIEHAPAPSPRSAAAVTVRDFKAEDMDAVMAVMEAAFDSTYGEAWTRSQCAGILPMAGVALRIADHGDRRVAGFALLRAIADEAELLLIAVAPDAQHRGVGAALIEDFVGFSTARGARRLHLEVRDGNNAIALYERAGFSLAGRRREYYRGRDGHKRDALTLAFTL
jgi:ribosomal-protein-alanine N-acetyltransferase